MHESIPLGRIAGVRIGLNWSWFVVLALIAWSLADQAFPEQNPGLSRATHVAMAIVAALLFFVSILLHELGHAVQARRDGVEIDGITLWLFGGVARLKGGFPSAEAELRIAIAGPLVSLAIGGTALVFALLPLPEPVDGVAAWLGTMNLALLVFNLLPALPLDGGRVLRALLWRRGDDFGAATRTASTIGQALALGLIGLGFTLLIVEGALSGAWMVFLGWFLLQAAGAEGRAAAQHETLSGLRVRDLMVREPATVDASMTLGRVVDTVLPQHRHTTYPVLDGDRPIGLLTLRRLADVPRVSWDRTSVRDVTLMDVPLLAADEPLEQAFDCLAASAVGRGLVVEDGRLAGFLSVSDLTFPLRLGPLPRRQRTASGR